MVDIILPVFNAASDLRRCLHALAANHRGSHQLIMIDDASTDPDIGPILTEFASAHAWAELLINPANLGFIGTTNRGMAQSRNDVVLLNSDTQVTEGWLDALLSCSASDSRIATATPFSNNAEICSLPEFCVNNPLPEDLHRWGVAVRQTNSTRYPDLPTGVGFCMYIRRAALDQLGLFDPRYGRGYGEENDFCRRAAEAGWRNVLCDNAFVAHAGGKSFAPLKITPNGDNLKRLLERFPDYETLVANFIASDPIKPIREAIMANYRQTH